MSVFYVVADTSEITIIADSQSSNIRGEIIEHGVPKIWEYNNMIIGVAGGVDLGKYLIDKTNNFISEYGNYNTEDWIELLEFAIGCHISPSNESQHLEVPTAILLAAILETSSPASLVLHRYDICLNQCVKSQVGLLHEPKVYIVPPKDLSGEECRSIFDDILGPAPTENVRALHRKMVDSCHLAVQKIALRSQYVDNIVQEKSLRIPKASLSDNH